MQAAELAELSLTFVASSSMLGVMREIELRPGGASIPGVRSRITARASKLHTSAGHNPQLGNLRHLLFCYFGQVCWSCTCQWEVQPAAGVAAVTQLVMSDMAPGTPLFR